MYSRHTQVTRTTFLDRNGEKRLSTSSKQQERCMSFSCSLDEPTSLQVSVLAHTREQGVNGADEEPLMS
jgi:hypothetical protein